MAITGSGTQSDPYICESFEDLKAIGAIYFANETAPEIQPQYVKMSSEAANKIIDFNNIAPDGLGETNYLIINIGKEFDGNDWTITNLSTADRGFTINQSDGAACIKNWNITNFSFVGTKGTSYIIYIPSNSYFDLQNVKIYGEASLSHVTDSAVGWILNTFIMKTCVIKLKINLSCGIDKNSFLYFSRSSSFFSDNKVCNNNIDIDIDVIQNFTSQNLFTVFNVYNDYNIIMGNKVKFYIHSSNGSKITSPSGYNYDKLRLCNTKKCFSNVFEVKIENNVLKGIEQSTNSIGNIINSDLLSEESENNFANGYILVTTEEMKNPAVLREKGFACYGVKT